MKVLFIQKEGGIFGAEQFHLRTIPALVNQNIEVEFLRLYTDHQVGVDSPFVHKLRELGIRVYQVKITGIPMPSQFLKIKRIIQAGNYDIVHTHLIHADFYGAVVKSVLLPKIKLVSTKHGYEEGYNNKFGFDPANKKRDAYWWINKFSEKIVNRSFAISDGLKRFFIEAGISSPGKIERIHYGFEMKDFNIDEDHSKYRFAKQQLVIAGRLVGFKGHRYALEALNILKNRFPDIQLLIIGIGELEQDLINLTKELGIRKNVKFLGFRDNVQNYMYYSDLVLIPSIAEGFGVVFLEAINQRKPIIAFDVPAGNEILPKAYNGYLVPPFDVDQLASKIQSVLENPAQMIAPIDEAEKRLLSYFNINRMVNEMKEFYNKVITTI